MPRLLLISYFFAPEATPGALRAGALARYLPLHGWEVDLLTRVIPEPAPNGRTLVVAHKAWLDRLRHDLKVRPDLWLKAPPREFDAAGFVERKKGFGSTIWNLFRQTGLQAATWPDRSIDWTWSAGPPLGSLVRERPPDAILSTSPPETTHFLGRTAARISGAPWIADLRDPWSGTQLMSRPRWRTRLDEWTERQVLSSATALTTVSTPIAERLRDLHPHLPVREIRNGFDSELFAGDVDVDRTRFTITYTGSLVFGRNDLESFLEGARRYLDQHPSSPLAVRFVGETSPILRQQISRFRLDSVTVLEPQRPHRDAVAAMRTAPVLLFFPWQDRLHQGVYTAKLFEYLGARRPILAVGAIPGVAGALLQETGAGMLAKDPAETASLLSRLYAAHSAGKDAWGPSEASVLRYSHQEMVRQFADELDRAIRQRRQGH